MKDEIIKEIIMHFNLNKMKTQCNEKFWNATNAILKRNL